MKKGSFIALEGIDGSGKSTQAKKISEYLIGKGHKVYTTFEPTDSPIGKMIRDIFSHKMEGDQKVIAALFAADRLDHLLNSKNGILKKIKEGFTVITDRYYLSSYAYHSVHDIDLEWIIQANAMSADILRPDVNIYIDISPELSLQRLKAGRTHIEMYETLENLTKVHQQYKLVFDRVKGVENIIQIDGNRPKDEVSDDIIYELNKIINHG
jgi:dTMP kinase